MRHIRKGSILVLTLVATAMVSILVGAMGAYYVHSARLADSYMTGRSEPRAVAQGAIEQLNQKVAELSGTFSSANESAETLAAAIEAARQQIESGGIATRGEIADGVTITAAKVDGKNQLRVAASVYKGSELVASVEEIIEFYYGGSSEVRTLPYVFDYVYFVDNYGHLESPALIVNGDAHANDKFTVNGPVINGFVNSASNAVEVTDGKIWSAKKYAVQVKAWYGSGVLRTPVRPTNPVAGITWPNGYEPPLPINPYVFTNLPPSVVEKPDDPLVAPTFPDPGDTRPADPRPFSEPPTEITPQKGSTTTTVTKWKYVYYTYVYYTHTCYKHVYYTNSKKSGKYYSSKSEAENAKSGGVVTEHTDYYATRDAANTAKNNKGKKGTVSSAGGVYNTRADADAAKRNCKNVGEITEKKLIYGTQSEANGAKRDNGSKGTITEIVEYYATEAEANRAKRNNGNKGTITTVQETETVETTTYLYNGTSYATQAAAETARDTAQSEYESNLKKLEDYEKYPERRKAWDDYYDLEELWGKYTDYLGKKATYDADYAVYTNNVTNWTRMRDSVGLVTDLAEAATTNANGRVVSFVKSHVDYKPMLNVSDSDGYRSLCEDEKGTLECDNSYKVGTTKTRIVWKNLSQVDVVRMMLRQRLYGKITGWGNWTDWSLDNGALTRLILDYVGGKNPWTQASEHPLQRELSTVAITGSCSQVAHYPFSNYNNPYSSESESFKAYNNGTRQAAVAYPKIPDSVKAHEKNSVILIGTDDFPIRIHGPVYIDGDVIIRGAVSGRGAIYSSRNIHIIGDLVYKNPPDWPFDGTGLPNGLTRRDVETINLTKDLLLLSARGNIVIGDYTASKWQSESNLGYLRGTQGGSSAYGDNYDDAAIGYGSSFKSNRNYTLSDGGSKVVFVAQNKDNPEAGQLIAKSPYFEGGITVLLVKYEYEDVNWHYAPKPSVSANTERKFYECTLGDEVIQGLKQISGGEPWQKPPTPGDTYGRTGYTPTVNVDPGDITRIDAVLFANHGIMGVVGGTTSHTFTLNGAMVCRDESLFPSFDSNFAAYADRKIWLNWDMRIKSDDLKSWVPDRELVVVAEAGGSVTNRITSWRQVK